MLRRDCAYSRHDTNLEKSKNESEIRNINKTRMNEICLARGTCGLCMHPTISHPQPSACAVGKDP